MHPGQFQLATAGPASTEPWQEQVAQARKAAAASAGETPAQYQAKTAAETKQQQAQEKQARPPGRRTARRDLRPADVHRLLPQRRLRS